MNGSIGIIACPYLEDELVFAIAGDADEKKVFVVDNGNPLTLIPKLKTNKIEFSLIKENEIAGDAYGDGLNITIIMEKAQLHSEPKELMKKVEEDLTHYQKYFDVIGLYYGMCGNYGWDVSDWAEKNLSVPVVVFRDETGKVCDDCIGVAVGGVEEYRKLMLRYAGVLFLTPATATNWDMYPGDPKEWEGFYDSRDDLMRALFEFGGYKNSLKIDTGIGDRENYLKCAEDVSSRMGLKLIEPDVPIATTKLATKIYSEIKEKLA